MFARSSAALTVILVFVIAGQAVHSWDNAYRGPIAVSIVASSVTTFFWFLSARHAESTDRALRKAIAGSMVVGYLVMVGNAAVWQGDDRMGAWADAMVNSFTVLVGVVVASYFGAAAYVEGKKTDSQNETKKDAVT